MRWTQPTLTNAARCRGRRGFTTVELLLVMAIILVLTSLTVGAVFKLIVWARERSTERTIVKVHEQITKYLNRCLKEADKTKISDYAYNLAFDGDSASEGQRKERAKVIQRKLLLKFYFPMSYQEAEQNVLDSMALTDLNGSRLYQDGHPVARAIWQKLKDNVRSASGGSVHERAACLFVIYELAGGKVDDLAASEWADTDPDTDGDGIPGDGTRGITDAFGTPMGFYRNSCAPAFYVARAQQAYPGNNYDIDDPAGRLANAQWLLYVNPDTNFNPDGKTNLELYSAQFGHDPSRPTYLPLLLVSGGVSGGPTSPNYGFEDDDDIDSYRYKLSISGSQ